MNLTDCIELAANIAYDEDADQIIGRINGEWAIAHTEDLGRQAEMSEPKLR